MHCLLLLLVVLALIEPFPKFERAICEDQDVGMALRFYAGVLERLPNAVRSQCADDKVSVSLAAIAESSRLENEALLPWRSPFEEESLAGSRQALCANAIAHALTPLESALLVLNNESSNAELWATWREEIVLFAKKSGKGVQRKELLPYFPFPLGNKWLDEAKSVHLLPRGAQ